MRTAIIRNGLVHNVIEGTVDPAVHPGATLVDVTSIFCGPGFTYDGSIFTAPVPPAAPRHITRLALFERMADAEMVAIEVAGESSPQIRVFRKKLEAAQYINLDDPRVYAGLLALETAGLLASGRANAIVTAPVESSERP